MNKADIFNEVATGEKLVAITFDDGPHPEWTPLLLDAFRQHGAKATFYVVGSNVERYPDIAERIHAEGHELGNHTYSHPHLSELGREAQREELSRTDRLIAEATGDCPKTFRPPYLDVNDDALATAAEFGYAVIHALNLDSRDWDDAIDAEHILTTSRAHVREGSILIYHDGFGDRSPTIAAVSALIPELIGQGYRLVTVSELLSARSR
ncbi:polysaccharide deacetylase family protein [Cohnella sp. GCM10027633]|uniref:polysaccharide deacetylase family protein n=1 Tax=unclassified Cohnella TaxID=2636738 RepID=UPI00364568C8